MTTPPPSIPDFLIVGLVSTLLGPALGSFALIVFGALAGGLLALGQADVKGRWDGVKFLLVGVVLALALAGAAAWALERYYEIPGFVMLMPVSAVIGAGRNVMMGLIEKGAMFLGSLLPRSGG